MGRSVKGTEKAQSGRGIEKAEVKEAQRHKVIFGRDVMLAPSGRCIVKAEVVEAQSGRGTKAQSDSQ